MAFFRNSVAACVRQETGQRKHRTSLSEQPVCRDSPPRLELSLLCVCSFTSVNALLQHLIGASVSEPPPGGVNAIFVTIYIYIRPFVRRLALRPALRANVNLPQTFPLRNFQMRTAKNRICEYGMYIVCISDCELPKTRQVWIRYVYIGASVSEPLH